MKVVTEDKPAVVAANAGVANGYSRLYNKLDGSTVDVHAVDAKEYVKRLPHLWSFSPVVKAPVAPKEQVIAEDAVIVPEPAKEKVKSDIENPAEAAAEPEPQPEPAPVVAEKPISARSRKLAKFD